MGTGRKGSSGLLVIVAVWLGPLLVSGSVLSTFARVTLWSPPKHWPAQCVLLFPSLYREGTETQST